MLGFLYSIDPLTSAVLLMTKARGGAGSISWRPADVIGSTDFEPIVLLRSAVRTITPVEAEDVEYTVGAWTVEAFDSFFATSSAAIAEALSDDELQQRKAAAVNAFEKHFIPVEQTVDGLCVMGQVYIAPPYGAAQCASDNEIALIRIQKLLEPPA